MIVKEEQHKQELAIYANRHDAGMRATRDWLYTARELVNGKWPNLAGDDLIKAQGSALMLNRLIEVIDNGPKIKS